MFWTEHLLPDLECLLKQRLGLGVIAHIDMEIREVIEKLGSLSVFWTEDLLKDLECLFIERFGLGVLAHLLIENR